MNTYQENVLAYFVGRGPSFVHWMTLTEKNGIVVIGDLCERASAYTEAAIRQEMALYERGCDRYHFLIDMLIELKTKGQNKEGDFYAALKDEATKYFRTNLS